ncbi:MAG: hypothetical protein U9R26_02955 [Campylobacterota bacterium]|nr:hypothetical protein [Campylobacterota bacterium]
MKKTSLLLLLPITMLCADTPNILTPSHTPPQSLETAEETPWSRDTVMDAVDSVERARKKSALKLKASVAKVLQARAAQMSDANTSSEAKRDLIKINEALSIANIAKSAAYVEVVKANATSEIAKAVASVKIAKQKFLSEGSVDEISLKLTKAKAFDRIAEAVASVEIAKAKATGQIIKATESVELSKTESEKALAHPKEALSIAKNVSAVEIARAASAVEVARAVSAVEITESIAEAKASKPIETVITFHPASHRVPLADVKAKAAAKIAGSVAKVEVTKANAIAEIAHAVARVEIAEVQDDRAKKQYQQDAGEEAKKNGSSTYPAILIRMNRERY